MLTIEELVELTGYTKNTIYTHSVGLGIKPIRGIVSGNAGKGLYRYEEDLGKLLMYKELINDGYSKEEAYKKVRAVYEP